MFSWTVVKVTDVGKECCCSLIQAISTEEWLYGVFHHCSWNFKSLVVPVYH